MYSDNPVYRITRDYIGNNIVIQNIAIAKLISKFIEDTMEKVKRKDAAEKNNDWWKRYACNTILKVGC